VIEHSPWIGPEAEFGIDGQRTGIIGYSHWLPENEKDRTSITIETVSRVISGCYNISFFNHIRNYFEFREHASFWNQVTFFNFLPSSIGGPDHRFEHGTEEQKVRGCARLLRLIKEQRMQKVLVFTSKTGAFPKTIEQEAGGDRQKLGEDFGGFSWGTYGQDEKAVAFFLRHTQGARGELMRRAVKNVRNVTGTGGDVR
jgi:hypothetical protein